MRCPVKLEFFVLPEVMRRDFTEAFVLDKDDFATANPDWVRRMEDDGIGFDRWYEGAFLWDKMNIPEADFVRALSLLRAREGKVLFLSESETSGHRGGLVVHGREVYDFVAMADPAELADCIEYEWKAPGWLCMEGKLTLPEDLYVFDTTLEWVIVFTHEFVELGEDAPQRICMVFGLP